MNPQDSSPASEPVAPTEQTPVTPAPEAPVEPVNNAELDTEMTQEQEDAYVAQVLGHSVRTPVETPGEVVEPFTPIEPETPDPVTPVEPETKPEAPVEEVTPVEIEDIKTDDLFVELKYKVEDDEGELVEKSVKLTYDPANPKNFIPEDLNGLSVKQIADLMESKAEMAQLYKERVAEYDEKLAKVSVEKSNKEQLDSWNNEIATLREAKLLDGEDKTVDSVFEYMTKTNIERAEKGIPPIVSFGTALAMYNKDSDEAKAIEAKNKENENAKRVGAMVGGGSAASTSSSNSNIYTAGSAKSIHDIKVTE